MKKTITKKITGLLVLLFAFISFASLAQTEKTFEQRQQEREDKAGAAFKKWFDEGEIIIDATPEEAKYVLYTDEKGVKRDYPCQKVKINRILKGDVSTGYINIHTPGAIIQDEGRLAMEYKNDRCTNCIAPTGRCLIRLKKSDMITEGYVTENKGVYLVYGDAKYIGTEGLEAKDKIADNAKKLYQIIQDYCGVDMGLPKKQMATEDKAVEKKSLVSKETINNDKHIHTNQKTDFEKRKELFWLSRKANQKKNSSNRSSGASCTNLFISEYLDGSSSNNAIEIYNPTASPISLTNYKLLIYHNASLTPTTIALTGTISAYGTHVVAQQGASSAILAHANQTTSNLNFNGDVVTALNKGNAHIDIIGKIGVANAAGNWTLTPSGGTNNSDIRRKYNIGQGDTVWLGACQGEWTAFSEDSISNIGHHANICSSIPDPDLIYSLANPQTTGTSPKYFEFDITVKGNNDSSYVEDADLYFNYNTAAFGTKIYTNGKLTITKGALFSADTSYQAPFITDQTTSEIQASIDINFNDTAWNLVHITTNTIVLMHVKIEVSNCYIPTNINLVHPDSSVLTSIYYTAGYTGYFDPFYFYDAISYDNPTLNISTCSPIITGFGSPSVIAGAFYTGISPNESQLIIQGSGFGGSGTVLMKNAVGGSQSSPAYIPLDNYDITFWSDNQITVNVPSILFPLSPSIYAGQYPGTGFVKVVNSSLAADTAVSTTEIQIPYILVNTKVGTTQKYRIDFAYRKLSDSTGTADSSVYIFKLDSATITHNADTNCRPLVKQAIHDWACALGIKYRIAHDTTITTTTQDGISYVTFRPTLNSPNFIAQTTTRYSATCSGNVFSTEADIDFIQNPVASGFPAWGFVVPSSSGNTAVGKSDFYSVALHEVGHASLLLHVNDTADLMYYRIFISTTTQPIPIGFISTENINGGDDNVVYSKNSPPFTVGCSTYNPLTLPATTSGACASPTSGIETIGSNTFEISVYPNPAGNYLNVTFVKERESSNTVKLTNTLGQTVFYRNIGKNEGANEVINTSQLAKGMYILTVTDNANTVTKKIIVE